MEKEVVTMQPFTGILHLDTMNHKEHEEITHKVHKEGNFSVPDSNIPAAVAISQKTTMNNLHNQPNEPIHNLFGLWILPKQVRVFILND